MLAALSTMGLESAWLPLLVAMVGLPALYINLAMDAFKDYADLIKSLAVPAAFCGASAPAPGQAAATLQPVQAPAGVSTGPDRRGPCDHILDQVRDELKIFDLDWWVVAALGVLLFAMICASGLPSSAVIAEACSSAGQGNIVKAWMSLYATAFGLLIGFRLVWARLAIARIIRTYHEARLSPPQTSGG